MRYLSISQLSEITGKDRRTISKYLVNLAVHTKEKNAHKYDAHLALPIIFGNGSKAADDVDDIDVERARLTRLQAEKAQIDLDLKRRQLIPIDEVVGELEREYSYTRAQLIGLPSRMAQSLAVETDPAVIRDELAEAINQALEEMSADARRALQLEEINQHGFALTTNDITDASQDDETEADS